MARVYVRNNNIEEALKIFKSKCIKEGILKNVREKSVFESPSDEKRRKNRAKKLQK